MAFTHQPTLLGKLIGANFNTTNDQSIPIDIKGAPRYVIDYIVISNPSGSITLAVGGFYTGAGKTGTTLVANTQVYSALTGSTKWMQATLAAVVGTDVLTAAQIYFALTTPQGGAMTGDIHIFGRLLG